MRYADPAGKAVKVDGREITPLPANHTVPAVGYRIDSGEGSLVFQRRHDGVRRIVEGRQQDPQPALSHHRNRLLQSRAAAGQSLSKHLCPTC
jgi:hypothetical protein